jgi:hypothetical protein
MLEKAKLVWSNSIVAEFKSIKHAELVVEDNVGWSKPWKDAEIIAE